MIEEFRENFIREAVSLVGRRSSSYHPELGLDPERGFDCSGLVTYLLRKLQFPLEADIRNASHYCDRFGVRADYQFRQPGDLVIWSWQGVKPDHIGILITPDTYVHAPGKIDTRVTIGVLTQENIPYNPTLRQLYAQNPIAIKKPTLSNGRWQQIL